MLNIILIGFQGCGKTSCGRRFAEDIQRLFIDTDEIIGGVHGSCREICAKHGEAYFRMIEKRAVKSLEAVDDVVIATGGGTVLSDDNVAILKKRGFFLYLKERKGAVRRRLFNGDVPAYLAKDNLSEDFEDMYEHRKKIYESIADHVVEIENG